MIRAALVKALGGTEDARIHARGGQDEVVVTRLGRGLAPQGLLLQVHDVTPYFGLDDIKSNVIRSARVPHPQRARFDRGLRRA